MFTTPKASSTSNEESSLDMLPSELQNTIMEKKFDQIRQQRQEAHNVLRQAKQRTRNQQTDQQILLLMQADERLAALLSQAADSMRALLPVTPPAVETPQFASGSASASPSHGAKAFEDRAQQWFSILNEVQYSLRSAVRYLRDAQLSPLTPPAAPDARQTGKAGSAARGHNLSLLEAFVDLSGLDGTTFELPPTSSTPASTTPSLLSGGLPEASLSLQALRERQRNWKALSGSLHQMHQSMMATTTDPTHGPIELSLLESIRNGCSSDRVLIDALVNTDNMAQ
ncbi:uncharacterized protein UTRI_02323 [Ustilago trichophora]|uniref:Mediator of RNA polymerase II transcription subunit 11 n=1 Tax=Ustilago trichophora TaxID=86804 RepID=A0A5C3EA46_9BASI|nr:uncharacterized protein UTRI_02323 [Ustilago trichophora]